MMTSRSRVRAKGFTRPSTAEERRLLRAAQEGDRQALEELLTEVSGPIYRFGRTFCRDPHDAEDVMQDVLAAIVRTLPGFRGDASLSTWAFVVTRNACRRHRRVRKGQPERTYSLHDRDAAAHAAYAVAAPDGDPRRALEQRELREALVEAIAALPATHKDALLLRDVEGLSAAEAARALGISERALKSRLHRARLSVRAALAPFVDAPSCPDIARAFSRHVEGDLDASACARLEAHLARCAGCGEVCASLRTLLRSCRSYGQSAVPRRVRSAIRTAWKDASAARS